MGNDNTTRYDSATNDSVIDPPVTVAAMAEYMINPVPKELPLQEELLELTVAIVLQAAEDRRKAVKRLRKKPGCRWALERKAECEKFFRSEWFELLTGMDGSVILKKLQQEENL